MFKNCIIIFILISLLSPELIQAGCAFGRGKPQAECDKWLVLNAGWYQRLNGSSASDGKSRFLLNGDLGLMVNISKNQAVGGSFYLSGDDDGSNYGFLARYRKFVDEKSGYDINVGLILAGDDNYLAKKFPGFIAQAGISYKDWVGVMFHAQIMRYDLHFYTYDNIFNATAHENSGTLKEYYIGLKFGSYLAILLPIVVGVIVALSFRNFRIDFSN